MGYNVTTDIYDSSILIKRADFPAAYAALCKLNDYDLLKRGGVIGTDIDTRPKGLNYNPDRWFSWMDADYPSQCKTLESILDMLGFTIHFDNDSNIIGLEYDNKMGQEDLFFSVLAKWIADGSYMTWHGEDGDVWRWGFDGGQMYDMVAETVWKKSAPKPRSREFRADWFEQCVAAGDQALVS